MVRVKILPGKLAHLTRFRCTCGHCEDLPDHKITEPAKSQGDFVLEGFQEML
jgi:hypothetical protein